MACALRTVQYLRVKDESQQIVFPKELSLDEMKRACKFIVRMVQTQYFQDERLALESEKKVEQNSRLTRQILRRCITCPKRNESPMKQMMGDLPKARLTPYEPPFTYTGLDLFGPFYVKRGRATEKVYGCIFVCFTTRAIHIEDVGSLESDDFLQALRRFICT